ncbi:glycosyltransferase [Paracoccaceae bacterium]|nr:glycosyltransferase [Paracoccaceae bacterium]
MKSISDEDREILGIGVSNEDISSSQSVSLLNCEIDSVTTFSRKLTVLPKLLKNTLVVFEITFRMFRKSIRFKPAIIHCHDTPVLPLALLLKIFTGAKVIYDAHELESQRNGLSKIGGMMTLFVERRFWRYVDRLIVVSFSIQLWYDKNVGYKKSEVILNSPLLEPDSIKSEYLRDKFSIPKSSLIFIYNGIFVPGRGIDLLISVFQNVDVGSHIVFLGDGELKEKLVNLSNEYDNIHVHDMVPHETVVPITRTANVGLALIENVSLSDYYCLPNKLFEYAFSGIQVLASNFPDISSTVREYNLGECCDVNYASLLSCVKKFELKKEQKNKKAKDLDALSWQAQEVKLRNLYLELIQEVGALE